MSHPLAGVCATLLVVALQLASGCTNNCTDIGCSDTVRVQGLFPESTSIMNVEVCVDERCEALDLAPRDRKGLPWGAAHRDPYDPTDTFNLLITLGDFYVEPVPEGSNLRVTVTLAGETTELNETVRYRDYYPNGEGCAPVCDRADFFL